MCCLLKFKTWIPKREKLYCVFTVFFSHKDATKACEIKKFFIGGGVITVIPAANARQQPPTTPPSQPKSSAVLLSELSKETEEDDIRKYFHLCGWPTLEVRLEADGPDVKKAIVLLESSEREYSTAYHFMI